MRFSQTRTWRVRTLTPGGATRRHATLSRLKCVAAVETTTGDADVQFERSEVLVCSAEADQAAPTTATLSNLAEQIFTEGAESLNHGTPKPLKINRDLALYKARYFRKRGVRSKKQSLRDKRFRQSEAYYRKVLGMDPTDCRAYVGLGKLFEEQKRYDEARRIYEDGCSVSAGTNAHLWTCRGNLEVRERNVDHAREFFNAAVNADRSHEAAWHAWGMMEKSLGDYRAARDCWQKGIRYAKKTPSPYLYQSLALLASELEMYDQAQYWYKKGTETATGAKSHVMWSAWALMEGKRGDATLMRKLYEKSLKVSEINIDVADRLEDDFDRGHEVNPADPALLNALAVLESECGNVDQARAYFKKSVKVDPSCQYSWQAWGVLEARQQKYNTARQLFQQGVWADPKSDSVAVIFQVLTAIKKSLQHSGMFCFKAWGRMEERIKNVDVARTLYKYGLKSDPNNKALWDAWIQLEEAQENYVKAQELRNDFMQKRIEIVLPKDFSTVDESYSFVEDFLFKVRRSSLISTTPGMMETCLSMGQFSDWLTKRSDDSTE